MYEPIEPAQLQVDDRGRPYSPSFDDIYHSHDGAIGQARHVFLGGNGLPQRWRGRAAFTVLETGFGAGLNFMATWSVWRTDPQRCERLHFVSLDKHPFTATDLGRLHAAWPELADLSRELLEQWPPLLPGLHRLHLDGERVTLDLYLGDVDIALPRLSLAAQALYLDGFAPKRNPEMWSPRVCHRLARLCAAEATLATWSVSASVREALGHAGFETCKADGFGGKRQMLVGSLRPRRAVQLAPTPAAPGRHALVVGAGLAGTSVTHRLASRGWRIDLIDERCGPGQGASGNPSGVLRPLPSLDDNRLAQLTRAGTLYALRHLDALRRAGHEVRWQACGVLHLARDPDHQARQRQVVDSQRPPRDYLRFVDRDEASAIAGWPLEAGGWWFPSSGWISPPSLCAANLAAAASQTSGHFETRLARLSREDSMWRAWDERGALIAEAPVAVLANGTGIGALEQGSALPVRPARGQVTHFRATAGSAPAVVVCRLGYVTPVIDGQHSAGATFLINDDDASLRGADQAENLARLDYMLPGFAAGLGDLPLAGRVGFRPASPDRLPMIGPVPTGASATGTTGLDNIERHQGLYAVSGFGARGLVWSALAGELLASMLDREPLPLARDIVDALDPGRFLLKPARRAKRNAG